MVGCLGCSRQSCLNGLGLVRDICSRAAVSINLAFVLIAHFSENLGFLMLSSMLGGNVFSVAFGRNLDVHSTSTLNSTSRSVSSSVVRADMLSEPRCSMGRDCYVAVLYVTTTACCFSLLLSIWAAWIDRQKLAAGALRRKDVTEVIWDEDRNHA